MTTAIQTSYGFGVKVDLPWEQAVARTTELLKGQGFGVLTEIDVQKTLREKIGAEFRRYVILGACNPQLAHRALQAEIGVGALLPCNVTVWEEEHGAVVLIMDPQAALGMIGNEAVRPVADEARRRLEQVVAGLGA